MGKTLGIVALVFGIIGIATSLISFIPTPFIILWYVPVTTSVVGIICGGIGIKIDDSPGLAITGLVLGSVGLIIWILFAVIYFFF
jgi:hypothetical protein